MKRTVSVLIAAIVGLAATVATVSSASAATADAIDIQAKLTREGVLTVTQTVTLGSGDASEETFTQTIPSSLDLSGHRFAYTVADVAVVGTGTGQATVSTGKDAVDISVPASMSPFTLTYTVTGATTNAVDGNVDFTWILLQGLSVDISQVTGTVEVPPGAINYACQSGMLGALHTCSTYGGGLHGNTALSFTDKNLTAGNVLQAGIIFPQGPVEVTEQVAPIWTLGRALTLGGTQLGIAAGLLVVGGLALFGVWRIVRRGGYKGVPLSIAGFTKNESGEVEFHTQPISRPGMVGTLVDSSVDPSDILSTILDLAQRGHLRITELERDSYHGVPDWSFTRLSVSDELKTYERDLLDTLTKGEVKVSDLTTTVAASIPAVQDAVYKEVMSAGWFSRLPNKKTKWVPIAWVCVALAVVATVALMALTTFGLVGIALVAVSLAGLSVAYQSPAITATGAAVYAGLEELASALHAQDPSQMSPDDMYAQISRILPYAVVLGSWDRWLEVLVAADTDDTPDSKDLGWYHAPKGWHMRDLPASLDAFITVVTGRLFARV
ncbi:MAG: DUF2207 domain-containing protein [Propionibacteriaceae bacterium]|jgi:hypothetical protein|nr:DUF2207 domain-containing protein [Propionibacteriaceae bacterium]